MSAEVVLLDGRGRILSCNQAWQAFGAGNGVGLARDGWTGVDYLEVSRGPEGGDAARQGILDLLEGRRSRFDLEYPCHGPREQRWFEMTATRLDGQGGPWVVVSHVNITARHEVESLRRQRWQDAQAIKAGAERARFMRGFLNEVAHELNTPMTTLIFRVKALQASVGETEAEGLAASLDRLQRAVRGITSVGRALDQAASPQPTPVRGLARALEDLGPEARRRGLRIDIDLPDDEVRADPALLQECLDALATSAVTSCPAGGLVTLRASKAGLFLHLRLEADSAGVMAGSEADLWLLAGRELAQRAGLKIEEDRNDSRTTYEVKVPLASPPRPSGSGLQQPRSSRAA